MTKTMAPPADSRFDPTGKVCRVHVVDKGNLRAFADVKLSGVGIIRGFRIIQEAGKRAWVSVPQRAWTDPDGQRKFSPLIELTPDLKARLSAAILKAWERRREVSHA
jgi:DNA-binding cell septation regulator SpoVG